MINKIKVNKNRTLKLQRMHLGVKDEHNAEILQFEFPELINGIDVKRCIKKVKFANEDGAYVVQVKEENNNEIKLNSSWTSRPSGTMWVEIESPKPATTDIVITDHVTTEILWKSLPCVVKFMTTPDDSKPPQGEQLRIELTDALRRSIKKNIDSDVSAESTFEQLIGTEEKDYKDSVLWKLRRDMHGMTSRIAGTVTTGDNFPIASNVRILDEFLTEANKKICEVINQNYGTNWITLPWYNSDDGDDKTIEFFVREMPTELRYRLHMDLRNKLKALVEREEITIPINTSTLEETLNSIDFLIATLSAELKEKNIQFNDVSTKIINKVRSTMYNEPPENLTYTEAIDRIEDVRKDLEIAVDGNTDDTFPTLIDKAKNASYMNSIVEIMENSTTLPLNSINTVFSQLGANVKLPYANTENATSITYTNLNYIEEVGFDMTNIYRAGNESFFKPSLENSVYYITGLDRRNISKVMPTNQLFNNAKFRALYTDRISAPTGYGLNGYFEGCTKLQKIGKFDKESRKIVEGEYAEIDFTGHSSSTNITVYRIFYNCYELREVRFVPNTLNVSLDLSSCSLLSKESAISALYSCRRIIDGSKPTITFSAANPNLLGMDDDFKEAIIYAINCGFSVPYYANQI